ncbi:hypothetical protein COLO4_31447 [Corchorus olitorius]|uniref:LisH domain-containing protein n=1 Tax=Corchorus olitorius TaxID=93759 RepID=A0A1R3H4C5_9ROSI|nr:hypothetical protein COLO4_31447 [Corchorus olitorius]
MAESDGWDAEKMLDLYLHDYLLKKNMHATATLFRKEAGLSNPPPVVIESPEGFLQEWWSIFYDQYSSKQKKYQEYYEAQASVQAEKLMEDQLQNYGPILPRSMINQPGQIPISRDLDSSLRLLETNQLLIPKSIAASSSLMQKETNLPSNQVKREHSQGISLGRTIPMNPSIIYGAQKGTLPVTTPHSAGLNESFDSAQFNGWPLDLVPNYELQFQLSNFQPEISAQGLSHMTRNLMPSFPGSSSEFNYRDPILPKNEISGNKKQMMIQTKQTEEHKNRQSMLQSQQSGRKKKKISNSNSNSNLRVPDKKLDCTKAENKPVDDTVESFLSHADDNVDNSSIPFRNLRRRSNSTNKNEHKGFTFGEAGCLHPSKSKVLCCHFSSNGKFLASAGHEKKVVLIWNMETLDFVRSSECHSLLITDPSKSLFKLVGHAEQVLSLDFHPRQVNLLCSCDGNNEMRLWNINLRSCLRVSKGATKQVRFQPQQGKLIATASANVVSVVDVETDKPQFSLKGHNEEVLSICWDPSGKYIGSISEDSARLWSVSTGECLRELRATGNKFQSCTFHPGYSQLLVLGGYQSLELWNPSESNKTWTVEAHKGLISSLSNSLETEMVASTSHDQCVKIWK